MTRLLIVPLAACLTVYVSAAETPAAANSDVLQPRVWVEVESTTGAVSRLELVDITEGRLVMKSIEGLKFEVEQDDLLSMKVAGVGDVPPWKPEHPKRMPPPLEKPVSATEPNPRETVSPAQTGTETKEERIKQAIRWLRPTAGMLLYVNSMRRAGRLKEAQTRLHDMVVDARTVDVAMANIGGLLLVWGVEQVTPEQMDRNIKDTIGAVKDDEVRATAIETLVYLKEHPEIVKEYSRSPEPMRPGLMDRRGFRKPADDERNKKRTGVTE
jgi:hypothetical protein